jgi:hypothetical protein
MPHLSSGEEPSYLKITALNLLTLPERLAKRLGKPRMIYLPFISNSSAS